jgi:hypothetical protein
VIDPEWSADASYYSEIATRVLGEQAWGLVAAKLGNKKNRSDFVSRFWFDSQGDDGHQPASGFQTLLGQVGGQSVQWSAEVAAFRQALQKAIDAREARAQVYDAMGAMPKALGECDLAENDVSRATSAREEQALALDAVTAACPAAAQALQNAHAAREQHRRFRPGIVEVLFTLGRALREWRTADAPLADAVGRANRRATDLDSRAVDAQVLLGHATETLAAARGRASTLAQSRDALQSRISAAREKWGVAVPDVQWQQDERRRELAAPWLDQDFNAARTRVFLAALDLHVKFITATAKRMQRNLRGVVNILKGEAPSDLPEATVRAAWQDFFLVVPVVSTTFASYDRLFRGLGREALGWLLIDEAGQAAPQQAVGALWRARRAVVVGDPRQLEPIITIPHTAQQALRRHFEVAETWLPAQTSVQQLADRVCVLGTTLPADGEDDQDVWVGAPLRVHRRCDEPMFSISNRIAYGGLMVFGTKPRDALTTLRESCWIDVTGSEAEGHWIPAEGRALDTLLSEIKQTITPSDDLKLFVISPFRDVVRQLQRTAIQNPLRVTYGTVHTAQGKEAAIVILVLGTDPRWPGARNWAARKPNLLNVAVSRAKHRLYVIGNREAWKGHRYFDVVAAKLP